ncbi:MAG: hypothetical protein AAF231_09805 [Pseudomonadota bacterium]
MRVMAFLPMAALAFLAFCAWAFVPWTGLLHWAAEAQRGFQNSMAQALQAIRSGEPSALLALCSATAAYGFVHAFAPGHGKVLLGGVALASGTTLKRMTVLTVIASLAQSVMAIALVGGLVFMLGVASQRIAPLAEDWLAPLSYAAIAAIGAYLMLRGVVLWRKVARQKAHVHDHHHHHHHKHDHSHSHSHDHDETCGCGHAHGPSLTQVEGLSSLRDTAMLVLSIAIRPCTGALFVLIIALRFDVFWAGALSILTMGLGTAAFNLIVAWSGVAARRLSVVQSLAGADIQRVSAGLQVLGGGFIAIISTLWLMNVVA